MDDAKKKASERWYLQRFKDVCEAFPDGIIEDYENPDFLVVNDNVTVGIEITQLFRPVESGKRPMQEIESWQRRIHEEAKVIYEANGGPYLYVNVIFNDHLRSKKSSVDLLARKLVQIIIAHSPSVGDDFRIENPYSDLDAFPEEFAVIFVNRYAKATASLWTPLNAACVPDLQPALVQQRINDKNERVSKYKESCQEVWLLLVLDGSNLSSHMDIGSEVIEHEFVSQFERTYLFVNSDSNNIRLNHA